MLIRANSLTFEQDRRLHKLCGLGGLCLALLVLFAANQAQPAALDARQQAILRQKLGLRQFAVTELDVPLEARDTFELQFDDAGKTRRMILRKHSLLAENFQLLAQDGPQHYSRIPVPEIRTYRGLLQDDEQSEITASLNADGLSAVIHRPAETIYLEPLSRALPGAARSAHLVYRRTDVEDDEMTCGTDDYFRLPGETGFSVQSTVTAAAGNCASKDCLIAFDCDYEYFQRNGNSVNNCFADVALVMNEIDWIYYRDTGITYSFSAIIVRTVPQNPYAGVSGAADLLYAVRDEWNANFQSTQRDTAHLFSGKNQATSTIGVAYIGAICSSAFGYGMSHTLFSANLARRSAVTAHELGHNWNAQHCSGGSCNIMCPGIGGCSGVITSFSAGEISAITQFRDTRSCLADSNAGPDLELAPLAAADSGSGFNTESIELNVLDNDSDPNCADTLTIASFAATTTKGGTLTLARGRSPFGLDQLNYTPAASFSGIDSFDYTVTDGRGGQDTGHVTVDVQDGLPDELTLKLVDYLLGLATLTPQEISAGDMDNNGVITIADVVARRN